VGGAGGAPTPTLLLCSPVFIVVRVVWWVHFTFKLSAHVVISQLYEASAVRSISLKLRTLPFIGRFCDREIDGSYFTVWSNAHPEFCTVHPEPMDVWCGGGVSAPKANGSELLGVPIAVSWAFVKGRCLPLSSGCADCLSAWGFHVRHSRCSLWFSALA
jgi:hypothetical protein